MKLPASAGAWTRPDRPKRIDADAIFAYMNGAGELYLGYRFDHLDVYEYTAPGLEPILVELYWMQTSDDAFGLLANDWGGETVWLSDRRDDTSPGPHEPVPASRALYGGGLLRLWSDTVYGRVLATRETPESRQQVIALGRAVAAGRPVTPRPALLRSLPERAGAFTITRDRVWFLRSHLVLNSAYYLGTENMLDLSLDAEAVVAPYERSGTGAAPSSRPDQVRPHLLLARYADGIAARTALERFVSTYLRMPLSALRDQGARIGVHRIEHGHVGYLLQGRTLGVVLDAPDGPAATMFLEALSAGLVDPNP